MIGPLGLGENRVDESSQTFGSYAYRFQKLDDYIRIIVVA